MPLDEAAVARAVGELAARGGRGDRGLLPVLVPQPGARAAHPRDHQPICHPELMVSLSCEVDPAFREYERTCVTAFDAYIKPVVGRYLESMEQDLAGAGVGAPLADHAVARRHLLVRRSRGSGRCGCSCRVRRPA